jgi:hypothetical protein
MRLFQCMVIHELRLRTDELRCREEPQQNMFKTLSLNETMGIHCVQGDPQYVNWTYSCTFTWTSGRHMVHDVVWFDVRGTCMRRERSFVVALLGRRHITTSSLLYPLLYQPPVEFE